MSVEVLTALCCGCGEARFVKRCYVGGRPERRLRCDYCRATTMHAVVMGGDDDYAERANADVNAAARRPPITVVSVPGLTSPIVWVKSHRIALVRPELDPEEAEGVEEWLLVLAAED